MENANVSLFHVKKELTSVATPSWPFFEPINH